MIWLLAGMGCTRCTPVDEIEALAGDDDGVALTALRDFQAWTGQPICLSKDEQAQAGSLTRAEVFHDQCVAYDLQTGIASTRPDLFDGFGLDPSAFPTEEDRVREDFARTCADSTDQTPWVFLAESTCGVPMDDEDAFVTELFGDQGLPDQRITDVYLGSIEGQNLVFLDGFVLTRRAVEILEPHDVPGDQIAAYTLPGLELLWTELLEDAQYSSMLGGTDSAMIVHADEAWLADRDGIRTLPVPPGERPWSNVREGAPHPDGSWWIRGTELLRYDPSLATLETLPDDPWRIQAHPDGPLLWFEDHIEQPTTGLHVEIPWWSDYSYVSAGRLHAWAAGRIDGVDYKVETARPLEPGASFVLTDVTCDWPFGAPFPYPGLNEDYLADSVWSDDPFVPQRLDVWARRQSP